jgi:hypothetical protein
MEAWAPGVLQEAVDQCTNASGNMEDCPVFTYNSDPGRCGLENALPDEIASENVKGPMEGLPNRIQVQAGPERANKPPGSGSGRPDGVDTTPKKSTYTPESTPTAIAKIPTVPVSESQGPSSSTKAAGNRSSEIKAAQQPSSATSTAVSKAAEALVYTPISVPAPAPTSEPNEPPVALQAGEVITTAYWTSGREAHEVIVVLKEVTVTADGGKFTKTAEATSHAPHYKRQHKHQHHAAHGAGGRKLR